ncbi:hypothetical protein EUTSA_v10028243mg, partial [Eutrema salsugineum]
PYIDTPPSKSCRGGSAKHGPSQLLARRSPPCRRPRLQNPKDISHTTVPRSREPILDLLYVMLIMNC